MDGNARQHRTCIETEYTEQEAIDTIFWRSMSAAMDTIEHVLDAVCRNLNRSDPQS